MATGRKGSTSKAGGVHFPDDDEPPGSPTRRDDDSNLCTLIAIQEKDGSYLVKVWGYLLKRRFQSASEAPEENTTVPLSSCPASFLDETQLNRVSKCICVDEPSPSLKGGVKVTCEYRTHQEGVLQEEITLVTRGRKGSSLKVRFQAKVIDPHHGTPMLLEGVRCLDAQKHTHRKHSSDRERK
uniref:Uncharacterized protein n=1 Tax=Cyclopterus lumpus TaxID=8103 RepID=A0A8C3A969_CYCLU